MNENNFVEVGFPNQNMYRNYGMVQPELNSVEEIRRKEAIAYNLEWYKTPSKEFNQFLSERFGYDIEGFRKLYLSKHIPNFSEEEISGIIALHTIPEKVRVYFMEVHSVFELVFKYEQCKETVEYHSCSGPLPLHNDTISNFTIIRAKFSELIDEPENLEKLQEQNFFGYYFSDEKFRLIISSSMQLDLTVIYEEI